MEPVTYLDHNATTPIRPGVAEAMASAMACAGNPSSVHRSGRAARRMVEDARERVAALVGASPANVVFTSGGTEANHLAIRGCGRRHVIVSAVEHPSVLKATDTPKLVPVDGDGIVDLAELEAMLARDETPAVVSVMLANNETGVLQPVAAVAEIARRYGALVHCDAVQAAAKVAIDPKNLGVHMISVSAHKLGGPTGVGALIAYGDIQVSAVACGGGQERGRRAGTENVPGIVGFGVAAEAAVDDAAKWSRIAAWRDTLERRALRAMCGVHVFGAHVNRLPNTSCLAMPGADSEIQVMMLDLAGVEVSAGSACSSGTVTRSHVLAAMGVAEDLARSAIRVSLGWTSEERDTERFLNAWCAMHERTLQGQGQGSPSESYAA
ncbi:MAG: cysteine desulfurase [Rhodospirillales bacterium]|nr:cysteine desulfurase [Rhodospirillales bacterium]